MKKLNIIYQDKYLIVINKPSGLLTIGTEKEKDNTLFHKVLEYEKQKNKKNKIFIVHRLDKDTSGIVMFAKNEKIKKILQNNWNELVKTRGYLAIVDGIIKKDKGVLKSYLKESSTHFTYVTDKKHGKLAITKYEKITSNNKYTLLNINILTGRKNQIRVQFKELGFPIIGDKKYKSKTNPIKRLGLCANVLEFYHPVSKELLRFEIPMPREFRNIFFK